ncbi:class A sortase [Lactobacillus crispatus]|uniref:class A sortase n=1 Tax=Lactobacillus crispatus TaxID=47770 RepID=UPI0030FBB471
MAHSRVTINHDRKNFARKARKQKFKNFLALAVVILACIAIYVACNADKFQGEAAHYVATKDFSQQRKNKQKKNPTFNMKQVKPVSPKSIANAFRHRRDYRAVGQIAIRDHNVLLNIYRGVGNVELNLGAGTMNQHQTMGQGNYALAGHNMDDGRTYFSPLYTAKVRGNLPNGTSIFLTDYKKVYFYKITSSQFISVYNLKLAWNNKKFKKEPVISLFTCDWTGAGRLFIRGKYTGSENYSGASKYVRSSFDF